MFCLIRLFRLYLINKIINHESVRANKKALKG